LLLLPTESHVELALAAGGSARPMSVRAFLSGAAAALLRGVAPATPVALQVATFAAVQEALRERALPGASETPTEATAVALSATMDRVIGALRRSAHATAPARRGLAAWASAVQARVDARLRAAGWFDPRGLGALLGRAIASAPADALDELGVLGGAALVGVFPWDADDLLWIEAIHRRSRAAGGAGVVLRLPRFSADAGGAALAHAADPLADLLEKRWGALDDAPEIVWTSAPRAQVIAVRRARTLDAEARAVAAAVRDSLAEGVAAERLAIVVPKTAGDAIAPLGAALAEARVAYAEPRGRSILACPDGRAAVTLLALAEGPFTRDGLLEVLRAPGLHAGVWVEASDEVEAQLRVAKLASRLRDVPVDVDGSGRLFCEEVGKLAGEEPDEQWMPRAIERLVSHVRWLAEAGTFREGLRRFVDLLDRTKLGQPSARDLAAALADEKKHGALATASLGENASALRRLRDAVIEMGTAAEAIGLGGAPLSAAELRALVSGLAERTSARAGGTAPRAGAVRIGRPEEIAGLPYERVVVTGLVESAYGDDSEDEDLLAREEAASQQRASWRAPRRTLALAAALASAREAVLAYSIGDGDELEKPHALVVGAGEQGVPSSTEPASRVSKRASVLGPRSAALIALAGGRPPSAELAERVRIERARHAFFMDPRAPADGFTGRVSPGDGLEALLPSLVGGATQASSIAVTAIERAAGCAFAGFARRVLRIARKEDLAEAGDARERGTLVHRALSTAFEAARSAATREAAIAAGRAAAEQVLGLASVGSPLRREAILTSVRHALAVLARAWDDGEPARFLLAEQRFGAGTPPPWGPLELAPEPDEEDAPPVFVDGQIDRIDATAGFGRVRVIDYKTGCVPDGEGKRIALQLPMYAAVAARALGAVEVHAMYLRVTARGVIEEHPKTPSARLVKPEELIERAREARRAVRALWEGRIAPRPAFLSLCAGCDARDLCRRPAVMPIEEQEERP
jgi:RecB family exonuclease